jgi:hypothetical protein
MRLRLLKAIIFSIFLLLITLSPVLGQPPASPSSIPSQPSSTGTQNRHPLRPKPKEFTNWEKGRPAANYTQTLFCAQRPTAVQKQEFLKTDPQLDLQITGTYLSNFEEFITPLLSITNKVKDDYSLSYEEKAQQYLADYLGGRAYYELQVEPTKQELEASPQLQYDLFIRLGVFRKLAPLSTQDKFKRAMIYRASGIPAAANPSGLEPLDFFTDYYGFEPASPIVGNYPVTCWNNRQNRVVAFTQYNNFKNPCGKNKNIRLGSFDKTNWAPLPEEFDTPEEYDSASAAWKILAGGQIDPDTGKIIEFGKWAKAWPYVPMFSREDLRGYIRAVSPDADPPINPVYHPHLARTYELSSALSTLLLPKNDFDFDSDPNLETRWSGIPWCDLDDKDCKKWWIDSSDTRPQLPLGPVCDPLNTIITSSGDSAYDSSFTTPVNSPTQVINNPEYSQAVVRKCNLLAINDPVTYEKECKFKHDVRYSPDYFVTRTPYLNQIANRLISSQGVFNILRPKAYVDVNQPVNWPGLGNPEEASPKYKFIGGDAEAGMKQSSSLVEFYYKGLGFIHCQKEQLLATLQPFITGQSYQYLNPECAPKGQYSNLPGIYATGSCPIPDGYLSCGSYDPQSTSCNHGSNDYWSNKTPCDWALPSIDHSCQYSPYPGNVCYDKSSTCYYYGFAADFAYSDRRADAPVIYPEIDGQILEWELEREIPFRENSGAGAILRAEAGGNVYEIYITHLNDVPSGGRSGEVASTLYDFDNGKYGSPHVHLELKINGTYVRPDDLCN